MKRILTMIVVLFLLTPEIKAQEQPRNGSSDDLLQARLIKIRRMSEAWKNEPVELKLFGGLNHSGRFISIHNEAFKLKQKDQIRDVPVVDVQSLVLKKKPQDLVFVGIATVGVAALFAGGASLGFDTSEQAVMGGAVVGAAIGFTVGWRAFYQDIVIRLE